MCNCASAAKKTQQENMTTRNKQSDFAKNPDFVKVVFKAYGTYPRRIVSPTGVIRRYGLQHYGIGRNGTELFVHKDDVKAAPLMFEVKAPPQNTAPPPPQEKKEEKPLQPKEEKKTEEAPPSSTKADKPKPKPEPVKVEEQSASNSELEAPKGK